jgi:hypothetical protein
MVSKMELFYGMEMGTDMFGEYMELLRMLFQSLSFFKHQNFFEWRTGSSAKGSNLLLIG